MWIRWIRIRIRISNTADLGHRNLYRNITEGETDLVWSSRNNDDRLVAVIFDLKTNVVDPEIFF